MVFRKCGQILCHWALVYPRTEGLVFDLVAFGRFLGGIHDPQHEVDHDRDQQQNGQCRGPEPVVEAGLPTHPDRLRSPVIGSKCVYQRGDRDASEAEGGDLGGLVAEVEHADGEGADNDGEVKP